MIYFNTHLILNDTVLIQMTHLLTQSHYDKK
jgi:hypothetical protein